MKKLFILLGIFILLVSCSTSSTTSNSGGSTGQNNQTIAMVGDSITRRTDWDSLLGKHVNNWGVDDRVVNELVQDMEGYLQTPIDKWFIMIGINDIQDSHPQLIVPGLSQIIDKIKSKRPNSKIYIESILPYDSASRNSVIEDVNNQINVLCNSKGVIFINLYPLFIQDGVINPDYTTDGIHLSDSGYNVWANAIMNYVLS
jgi:lysophospholipase L1-like esterase